MNTMLDFINSLTPQQWFLIGGLIATLPGTYAIVEFVKAHHFKKTAEELWSGFVVLNVLFWGNVLVFADAILNNAGQITHITSLVPSIIPFVSVWGPRITEALLVIHIVAMVLSKFWKDRQARKPITNVNVPDLGPLVQAVTSNGTPSGLPSSSMGSAAAGVDVVQAPPQNLFSE